MVTTRAWGDPDQLVGDNEPDPVELEIRGVPCVAKVRVTLCTYAVQPPGSLFWSATGFRSMGGFISLAPEWSDLADLAREMVEHFIDAKPQRDGCGGLGGRLVRWWPWQATQWRADLAFECRVGGDFWAHLGPEKQAEAWAVWRAKQEERLAWMAANGIDPNDVLADLEMKGLPKFRWDGSAWQRQDAPPEPVQLSLF